MRKTTVVMVIALAIGAFAVNAFADDSEKAVAMVKKAAEYYKQNGMEKAFEEFSNPKGQFVKGELYLFVYDLKGKNLAHGDNPKQIGQNLYEIQDVDGKYFMKEMIEVAKTKGSGWVDYKRKNPVTKEIEQKASYLERVEDFFIACGIYKGAVKK